MRLIGFDPGLQNTGWGVIEASGNRLVYVADGVVTTSPKASLPERLVELQAGLVEVIREHAPAEACYFLLDGENAFLGVITRF